MLEHIPALMWVLSICSWLYAIYEQGPIKGTLLYFLSFANYILLWNFCPQLGPWEAWSLWLGVCLLAFIGQGISKHLGRR